MKIFILLMFLTAGGSDIDFQPLVKHIRSPEAAAVMLWDYNSGPDKYTGQLYCIDIGAGTVTELQIPELEFGYRADPDQGQYWLEIDPAPDPGQYELNPGYYGSITMPLTCNDCEERPSKEKNYE